MHESDSFEDECGRMLRQHDRDLFLCTLLAPLPVRQALTALYAFNAEIARARRNTNEPLVARMRLKWWHDALDQVFEGAPPHHPVARALARAVPLGLDKAVLKGVVEAHADALGTAPDFDADGLARRADAALGPVFIQALDLLGARAPVAERAAAAAARAWALVTVLRLEPLPADRVRPIHAAALGHRREAGRPTGGAGPVLIPMVLADIYLGRIAKAGFDLGHPLARRSDPGVLALPKLWWAAKGHRWVGVSSG